MNVQAVKDFFSAVGRGDKQSLLALPAEHTKWIEDSAFRDDVLCGLSGHRRSVPSRWLYDDRGSRNLRVSWRLITGLGPTSSHVVPINQLQ